MTVRPAVRADAGQAHAISVANSTAPQWTQAQFAEMLSPKEGSSVTRAMLVAEDNGEAMGFAVVSALTAVYPVEAELESIAVDPQRQRQGVGRTLMEAVVRWSDGLGAHDLRLEVRAGNASAIRLYRKHGFQPSGFRRGYYTSPVEDAVCMQRTSPRKEA